MEKRAIQVSHELWQQIMTKGQPSVSFKCLEGLPEDARFVLSFFKDYEISQDDPSQWARGSDPVFVFESDNWKHPVGSARVQTPWGESFPYFDAVFQTAECRTCKWWHPIATGQSGECGLTRDDDYVPDHKESKTRAVTSCDDPHPVSWLQTLHDFGCVQYEARDD